MGVVIYGLRSYGRIDAHGGEYAQTQFFHIDFVPLIPRSSFWVTQEVGGEKLGFPIKLHLRSVVATYLRVWGAVGAVVAFATLPPIQGVVVGGALTALSAWSWSWRSLRGRRAKLRSDFNAVALGMRCEPEHLTEDMRQTVNARLRTRWNASNAGRSPNDVARYGSKDVQEAVLAYGMLRIAAAERGRAGAEERAAADRLVDGVHDLPPDGEGPYRTGAPGVESAPMAELVSRLAAEAAVQRPVPGPPARRWFHHPIAQLAGLALLSMFALGGAMATWTAVAPAVRVTARTLDSTHARTLGSVAIDVEEIVDSKITFGGDQLDDKRLLLGKIGKRFLPIIVAREDTVPGRHLTGQLQSSVGRERSQPWLEALHEDAALDAATFDYYLDLTDAAAWRVGLFGFVMVTGTIVLWVLWLRAWVRRRRARRQPS